MSSFRLITADALEGLRSLPSDSVHCAVTSPPYWSLRSYLPKDHPSRHLELGHEASPEEYVGRLVVIFRELRRVLRPDGTLWINMGDAYITKSHGQGPSFDPKYKSARNRPSGELFGNRARTTAHGYKHKDLIGLPWMLALALRADGWYLRMDLIWHKRTPMPESVKDRPTRAHEYVFLLSKSERYYYDWVAVLEAASPQTHSRKSVGVNSRMLITHDPRHTPYARRERAISDAVPAVRNLRSVWRVSAERSNLAHFATYPRALVRPCIFAGTSEKGCCPECGAPWRRVVRRTFSGDWHPDPALKAEGVNRAAKWQSGDAKHALNGQPLHSGPCGPGTHHTVALQPETLYWRPTCRCLWGGNLRFNSDSDSPLPCTVLDPFAGAGTSGLVAIERGCDFIGIELNPEYARMAQERALRFIEKRQQLEATA